MTIYIPAETSASPRRIKAFTAVSCLAALVVGCGIYYSDTVFNYSKADAECIKFAEVFGHQPLVQT